MVTNVAILGSTGSVGTQALNVIRQLRDRFRITALTAGSNTGLLQKQIDEFKPLAAACSDAKSALHNVSIARYGQEGICEVAAMAGHDIVINALVGASGILPCWHALNAGHDVALANKESLVAAGDIITKLAKEKNARIIPVDSEHSAIYQCLQGTNAKCVRRIILTCSGGPFRRASERDLAKVTAKQALMHPTWKMGGKITVDSATLMNKGFEIIETYWLYGVSLDNIEIIVHPQSIVHSFVEFEDRSMLAQLSYPDMQIPIQYALSCPMHLGTGLRPLDLAEVARLDFEAWDQHRFPAPLLAKQAAAQGKTYPAVLNAANEEAVHLFLDEKIPFQDIITLVKKALEQHTPKDNATIQDIVQIDAQVKMQVISWVS